MEEGVRDGAGRDWLCGSGLLLHSDAAVACVSRHMGGSVALMGELILLSGSINDGLACHQQFSKAGRKTSYCTFLTFVTPQLGSLSAELLRKHECRAAGATARISRHEKLQRC